MDLIRRLTGVYHADGGVRGELSYAVGKLLGTAHCGLCDITHRGLTPKRTWTALTASLDRIGVPFDVVHRNERDAVIAAASDGQTPCVLAHTDNGLLLILGPPQLDALRGEVTRLATALREAATAAGLTWPGGSWDFPTQDHA
jgi:hypothetical protein